MVVKISDPVTAQWTVNVLNEMYKIILEFVDKIKIIVEYNDNGNAVKHGNQNLRRHGSLNTKASTNTYPYLDNDLVGEDNVALDGEEKNINIPNNCAQQDSILMLQTENDSQKGSYCMAKCIMKSQMICQLKTLSQDKE